jgi:uncharacterized membrane protein YphA (DoxX/SURF4 family)
MLDRPATHALSLPSDRSSAPSAALDRLTSGIGGDAVWLLARCCIGGIFVYSGFGKLTGLEGFAASLAKNGVPMADVMAVVGATVEFFGGLAIVLGLQTRYAALLMAAFTVSATLISHRFWESQDAAERPLHEEPRHLRRILAAVRTGRRPPEPRRLAAALENHVVSTTPESLPGMVCRRLSRSM